MLQYDGLNNDKQSFRSLATISAADKSAADFPEKTMTSTNPTNQIPSISIEDLRTLSTTPGTLQVTVKKVSGYFMPYVQFTPPDGDTILRGIIMQGTDVVATVDLADALTALEEIIGTQHSILSPEFPDSATLH